MREHILKLAREIEELSNSSAAPDAMLPEALERLVSALGAAAGAVWMLDGQGRLAAVCDVNLSKAVDVSANPGAGERNQQLLVDVLTTGQASYHSPDESKVSLPAPFLIILAALQTGSECVGVVEIFQRADAPAEARPGYLQFVEQMCGYISRYLERQQEAISMESRSAYWEQFDQFVLDLQRSLDVSVVAGTAANDGRCLLDCDRVSVVLKRGQKVSVKAISGQDAVNPRANLVRAMNRLATKVIAIREPISFTGKVDHLPRQIEEPLADYVQESGSRMVMVVPLFEPEPPALKETTPRERQSSRAEDAVIGCLVIEQVSQSQPQVGLSDRVELLSDHVAAALSNSRTYQRVFLLPVWRSLGRTLEWFQGRKLAKTTAVLLLVLAVGLTMVFVPSDYRVEGEGRLMPVIQREVFAPWDGEVEKIFVKGGDPVVEGAELLQLRNEDLHSQLLSTQNDLDEKQKLATTLRAQIAEAIHNDAREEELRHSGELAKTNVEIRGLEDQVEVLTRRESLLTIRAPLTGVVATFQIEQLLMNRPVNRGEILLEVMDVSGAWQLELEVEERRMGHILRAQQQLNSEHLPIEYILATSAESTYEGRLEKIATRAATSAERGSVVEVIASTNAEQLPNLRIGAEVTAKITCGKRSLGYVLFGDVVEFVQKHLWL